MMGDTDKKVPLVEIKNPPKMWWAGDYRVEPFMKPVTDALDRSGLQGQARTDIYNRAYEAVYNAINQYGNETQTTKEKG